MARDRGEFAEETTVGRMVWNRAVAKAADPFIQFHNGTEWNWYTWGEYGAIVEEVACGLRAIDVNAKGVVGVPDCDWQV